MQKTREELAAMLRPLVDRMWKGHCWIKTKNGPRRIDRPFTETELSEHVMKTNAYGLCPIAPGQSTCRTAALDLDSHKGATSWEEMVRVAETLGYALEMDGYNAIPFRSSGGKGVHLYLVWDDLQDAYSVREMLRKALEACGFKSGTAGVAAGEIEIFPKQDEVPHDGYGNMFVLPFAGKSEPIGGFQTWVASAPVHVLVRPERTTQLADTSCSHEFARLKSALDAIPNTHPQELNYEEWRDTIFAIHYATDGSTAGLSLAHEFSARSSKYEPAFLDDRVWPYIRSDRGGAVITDRTIYATAGQHGWTDPATLDEFDVIEDVGQTPTDRTDKPLRFNFQPADDFKAGKPPGWIVKGVIPEGELLVIFGESGSGKSFFALDLACSISLGQPWRGRITKQRRVGYIAAESAGGFRNRIKAYETQHDVTLPDLAVLADAPNFTSGDHVRELIHGIRATGPYGLIIVDTLAQVTPGANENAGEDMGQVIAHCRTIHKVTGATVLLIHHSGKDSSKGARGWSGLRAAADAEIEIARLDHDRVATITKLKDGQDGAQFGFKLKIVPVDVDEDNEVIDSCVIEHEDSVSTGPSRPQLPYHGIAEKRVWTAALALQSPGGDAPDVSAVVDEVISQTPFDAGAGKRDTRRQHALRALNALVDKGRLRSVNGKIEVVNGDDGNDDDSTT